MTKLQRRKRGMATIDPRLLAALVAIARRGASSEADADVISAAERTMKEKP